MAASSASSLAWMSASWSAVRASFPVHHRDEAGLLEPGGQVTDALVGGAQLRADHLGPLHGHRRLGVGGLLLLAGHPLAAELAQLRVVQRAADRARRAVDQGRGELGAHAVDARLAQPGGFGHELGRL